MVNRISCLRTFKPWPINIEIERQIVTTGVQECGSSVLLLEGKFLQVYPERKMANENQSVTNVNLSSL